MASSITAGNATNGLAFSCDNTGALDIKTGTGSGTTAISINSSQIVTGTAGNLMLVSGTAWNYATAVTSVDFTGIPSWAKRVTVLLNNVSTSSTNAPIVQIGTGSTPDTSGYTGYAVTHGGVGIGYHANSSAFSASVLTFATTWNAAYPLTGKVVFDLLDAATNTWVVDGMIVVIGNTNTLTTIVGAKALSSTLGMVRVTINGTDTFDAGSINILYE